VKKATANAAAFLHVNEKLTYKESAINIYATLNCSGTVNLAINLRAFTPLLFLTPRGTE